MTTKWYKPNEIDVLYDKYENAWLVNVWTFVGDEYIFVKNFSKVFVTEAEAETYANGLKAAAAGKTELNLIRFEAMREAAIIHLQRKEIDSRIAEHGRTESIRIDESYIAGKQLMVYRMIRNLMPEAMVLDILDDENNESFCALFDHNRNTIESCTMEQYNQLVEERDRPTYYVTGSAL